MKEEEKREERKEVVVLDIGIDTDAMDSWGGCCAGPFMPIRWR